MPCGFDHGDGAGFGRLRTGKATSDHRLSSWADRQSVSVMAGINLVSGPALIAQGRTFPQGCFTDLTTAVAPGNPSRTDSLQEIKACPRVDPRGGDLPSTERSSEEKSSESAHRYKTPSLPFTLSSDRRD
jgi:hypothetical protein